MKAIRQGTAVFLATLSLLIPILVFPGVAQASSDYDDLLHTTPSLFVYTDGPAKTQKMDISQSWLDSLGQTYAKRVAQNIGFPTNFMTELDAIVTTGGSLGVIMHVTSDGNTVEIVGSRDPHAYCGFVGDASTGSYQCTSHAGYGYIHADYFTHNSFGGNGCWSWATYSSFCSDDGMAIYDGPQVETGTAGYNFLYIQDASLSNYKFYFMHFDLTYPTGYTGEMIPSSPPPAKYVAMGDSFSSGEGNPPFVPGTDTNSDTCHRSSAAYPQLLQNVLNLGATAFVACSGATTGAIMGMYNSEAAQIDALSGNTQVVTITIGGNDVDFKDYAIACTEKLCGPGTFDYDYIMNAINASSFYDSLVATYESLLAHAANAQVYVSGYPYMAVQTSNVCGQDDLTGTWAVENQLNAVISSAVDDVRAAISTGLPTTHLHYVDPNLSNSPFNGKYLCNGGASDFNGLDLFHQSYSFHPNTSGHQDFAIVFESQM